MAIKIKTNLEQLQKQTLSDQSARSFIATDRGLKSHIEASRMLDQENAKQLQKIEKRTQQLKQKQRREREYLKRLKKIYQQQSRQFGQLQKVTKQALEEKSRQLEFLAMENTQLKEERKELFILREERQSIMIRNEFLESENKRLCQELATLQESIKAVKQQNQEQAQLIEKGIQSNQIQTQSVASNAIAVSLQEVEQLNKDLDEMKKKQIDEVIRKSEEQLRQKMQEIEKCNFIISDLLKKVTNENDNNEEKEQKSGEKNQSELSRLIGKFMKRAGQLSAVFENFKVIEKKLNERENQIIQLDIQINEAKQKANQKQQQLEVVRQQLQIVHDSQNMRIDIELENKQKKVKNFEDFERKLVKLIQDKMLKQHLSLYDIFINTATDIIGSIKKNINQRNDTGQKFIQSVMKIVEGNLLKTNDLLKENARRENQKIRRMTGFIQRAESVLNKKKQNDDFIDQDQRHLLTESTPDRFSFKHVSQNINQSGSSPKSFKKSILLQQDMDSAINFGDDIQISKEEALQDQLSNLKNSQVMLDSLKDFSAEGEESTVVKDVVSESSMTNSKVSQLSHAEQSRHYSDKRKTALLHAKLKKKKKQ